MIQHLQICFHSSMSAKSLIIPRVEMEYNPDAQLSPSVVPSFDKMWLPLGKNSLAGILYVLNYGQVCWIFNRVLVRLRLLNAFVASTRTTPWQSVFEKISVMA